MNPDASASMDAGYSSDVSDHACPNCGEFVFRIPRRLGDRIFSLIVPMHRYRCPGHTCQWEGNIRVSDFRVRSTRQYPLP